MHAEYARYPLSTTEVKIAVFNHSQQKYTCGNDYSLAFYNNSNQQWEALPTSPAFEDIGWVLLPKYPLISKQSNYTLPKSLTVRVNIVFIKHSIEIRKK